MIYSKAVKEQGAALVVAMLILSLVTIFAATMTVEYNYSVRRVSNQMIAQQSYSFLRATEAIAHKVLSVDSFLDSKNDQRVDNLKEIWATEAPPFVIEEGSYGGRLYDLQGRFNLNSLRQPKPELTAGQTLVVPYTTEQGIFIRLLQAVSDENDPLSQEDAKSITEAIIDWLDEDQEPNINYFCGEDDAYNRIDNRQAHRTANQPFQSVSELRLICNLPVSLFRRLEPFVTVWPLTGDGVININTAPSPVLRSIVVMPNNLPALQAIDGKTTFLAPDPMSDEEIATLVEHQKLGGYSDFAATATDLNGNQLWPNNASGRKSPLALYSDYFLLESLANLGDLRQTMSSVIFRKNGSINIVARSTGGL